MLIEQNSGYENNELLAKNHLVFRVENCHFLLKRVITKETIKNGEQKYGIHKRTHD